MGEAIALNLNKSQVLTLPQAQIVTGQDIQRFNLSRMGQAMYQA